MLSPCCRSFLVIFKAQSKRHFSMMPLMTASLGLLPRRRGCSPLPAHSSVILSALFFPLYNQTLFCAPGGSNLLFIQVQGGTQHLVQQAELRLTEDTVSIACPPYAEPSPGAPASARSAGTGDVVVGQDRANKAHRGWSTVQKSRRGHWRRQITATVPQPWL